MTPLPFSLRLAAAGIALLLVPDVAAVAQPGSASQPPPARAGVTAEVPRLTYEEIRVLSLSLADQRAVIQLPTGDQRVLAVGDEVPEIDARVVQVLRDRLVLREQRGSRSKKATGRQVWIYRYSGTGASRVQVLDRSVPPASGQKTQAKEAPRQKPPGR